uniref:Uncharacterized protein n=1 Tax=Bactrocera dorsalis TaxID=27457 RepID=A0A034WQD0_BACDO
MPKCFKNTSTICIKKISSVELCNTFQSKTCMRTFYLNNSVGNCDGNSTLNVLRFAASSSAAIAALMKSSSSSSVILTRPVEICVGRIEPKKSVMGTLLGSRL